MTIFTGTSGISGERWLRSLKFVIDAHVTPGRWLAHADSLLDGEAARWADTHPRLRQIFNTQHLLHHATDRDIETFTLALVKRFPGPEERNREMLELQVKYLKQGEDESLESYYRRAETLMHQLGGVDRAEAPLMPLEEMVLDQVTNGFAHGVYDNDLREDALNFWTSKSLTEGGYPPGLHDVYEEVRNEFEKSQFFGRIFGEVGSKRGSVQLDGMDQMPGETTPPKEPQHDDHEDDGSDSSSAVTVTPLASAAAYPVVTTGTARMVEISPTNRAPSTRRASLSSIVEEEDDPDYDIFETQRRPRSALLPLDFDTRLYVAGDDETSSGSPEASDNAVSALASLAEDPMAAESSTGRNAPSLLMSAVRQQKARRGTDFSRVRSYPAASGSTSQAPFPPPRSSSKSGKQRFDPKAWK
ncbi:hypothetical protein ACLMJK_005514 [Lecanora helva]